MYTARDTPWTILRAAVSSAPRHPQTLVKDFVGYDTVVMNWLISLYGGRGFLYGVHNNELFNLNYAAEFLESTEVTRFCSSDAVAVLRLKTSPFTLLFGLVLAEAF